MVEAIRAARELSIPFFGICLGMQVAIIEFARNVLGLDDRHSRELAPECSDPVISLMDSQRDVTDMGGTMRLGLYDAALATGSLAADLYGSELIQERHRHRYEVNNTYRDQIAEAGLSFSGTSPDGHLVEFVELPRSVHPFYIATQAHPELRSRPNRAHPLFAGLIEASLQRQQASRLFDIDEV
jgi:CTP synthase